ncbi:hypothetical protein U1Q18_019916 [Sarracenia purpurea var. burkii]
MQDEFASLPTVVPQGTIAIFAAHLMLDLWPSLELEGWEIDGILIDKAREYFGLLDLEKHTPAGGILHVCVGDALSPSVNVPGGYAGNFTILLNTLMHQFDFSLLQFLCR